MYTLIQIFIFVLGFVVVGGFAIAGSLLFAKYLMKR